MAYDARMYPSIRTTLGCALLGALIGFFPAYAKDAEAVRPPKPSGFNAELPYSRSTTAEGTLRIRFSVLETGEVEGWEILEVPSGIDDIHKKTRKTVAKWEFEPAQTANGRSVAGTYDHVWIFSPNYRYELARVYPKRSAEVHAAFVSLAKELKIKFSKKDEALGIYLTKWIRFTKSRSTSEGSKTSPLDPIGDRKRSLSTISGAKTAPEGARRGQFCSNLPIGTFDASSCGAMT